MDRYIGQYTSREVGDHRVDETDNVLRLMNPNIKANSEKEPLLLPR
jgi:hypothetical protein